MLLDVGWRWEVLDQSLAVSNLHACGESESEVSAAGVAR